MTDNAQQQQTRRWGRRIGAIAATVAFAATSWTALAGTASAAPPIAPAPAPAQHVYIAWAHNDRTTASHWATATAVNALFAHPYRTSSGWFYDECDGTAGGDHCFWINRTESTVALQVDFASNKVVDVTFTPIDNVTSGQLIHAWRVGDRAGAAAFATPTAVAQLFSHPYHPTSAWTPAGCDGAAGSIFCTWGAFNGNQIITQFDDVQTHLVVSVSYVPFHL